MKLFLIAVAMLMTHAVQANTYCRPIRSTSQSGPQKSLRNHCITLVYSEKDLSKGQLSDNGPTFFGNPPIDTSFRIQGSEIYVLEGTRWIKKYRLDNNDFDLYDQDGNVFRFDDKIKLNLSSQAKSVEEARTFPQASPLEQVSRAFVNRLIEANPFLGNPEPDLDGYTPTDWGVEIHNRAMELLRGVEKEPAMRFFKAVENDGSVVLIVQAPEGYFQRGVLFAGLKFNSKLKYIKSLDAPSFIAKRALPGPGTCSTLWGRPK